MVNLGCNPHTRCTSDRDLLDFYVTPESAVTGLLSMEDFSGSVWECACGNGAISEVLRDSGLTVFSSDIVERDYPCVVMNFLDCTEQFDGDIITNPPYKLGLEFVLKALELASGKVAMLFRIQFVEGIERYKRLFSKCPPSRIHVFVARIRCVKYSDPDTSRSAICFAWFIWDKKNYDGNTIIDWIDNT